MPPVKSEILKQLQEVLGRLFELEEDRLVESARLHEDLDIDSIDTIDLLIELKKIMGVEAKPEDFINSKTLGDIVDVVANL